VFCGIDADSGIPPIAFPPVLLLSQRDRLPIAMPKFVGEDCVSLTSKNDFLPLCLYSFLGMVRFPPALVQHARNFAGKNRYEERPMQEERHARRREDGGHAKPDARAFVFLPFAGS